MNETREDRQQRLDAEEVQVKAERKLYKALVRGVKANCHKDKAGLQAVVYQLEHLQSVGKARRGLSAERWVEAYKEGIERFKTK